MKGFTSTWERAMKRISDYSKFAPAFDVLKFVLTAGAVLAVLVINSSSMGYDWQWYRVPRYFIESVNGVLKPGKLLTGLFITIKISLISLVFSSFIGFSSALLRLSSSFTGRLFSKIYVETVRNTPLLIQLFLIYFIASPVFDISPFFSAVLALSLFEGAYASEIIRSGIESIDRGQWESAYSLGLSLKDTYRYIILPQAVKRVLPPLAGQGISLIKDSALVSTIAIYDLTMQGQAIISETFLTFEIWFTVAAVYLLLTVSLSVFVKKLERRMNTPDG